MIILDTNVLSELHAADPNLTVIEWFTGQPTSHLYMTAISEAEVRYGAEILPTGQRKEELLAGIERLFGALFEGRILPFDSYAAIAYAKVATARREVGRPISLADCQIASIAYSVGAAVATRNVKDFEECGIQIINPWLDDPGAAHK